MPFHLGVGDDDNDYYNWALRRPCGVYPSIPIYYTRETAPRMLFRWVDFGHVLFLHDFLKTRAMYNPPLPLITIFLYFQLALCYCFNMRVFRMKSTSFFVYRGWVNIFLYSITPNGPLRCFFSPYLFL